MSRIAKLTGTVVLLFGLILMMMSGCSKGNSNSTIDPDTGKHVTADWRTAHQTTDPGLATDCAGCHRNGANSPIPPPSPVAPEGTAVGCFNNTLCHAAGHVAGWAAADQHGASAKATANGFSGCQSCHGTLFDGGSASTSCYTCHGVSAPHPAAPWISSVTPTLTHTTTNEGNAAVCAGCHQSNAGTPSCFNNTLCHATPNPHGAGWNLPANHGAAAKSAPTSTEGFSYCQSCHGDNFAGGTTTTSCLSTVGCHLATSPHAPSWTSTSTYKHNETSELNAAVCALCHLGQGTSTTVPGYAILTTTVDGCFDGKICHTVGGLGCVDCHASVQTGTHGTPRDAVANATTGEFGLAWGHKKNGRGAVTNADCIVCHLEGEFATQARSSTYHGDGNIDLRAPDTEGEVAIKDNSGNAFTFTKFAFDTTTRTSAISNSVADVITHQFCLKCHDSGGATNTTARAGSSPSPTAPFGGGFTALDTASQFALTNSSRHPVLGPLNKDYPATTRMNAPYNQFTRTVGTKSNGVVLNCFDCHNTPTTPLATRTVSAHGNAITLRGNITGASASLCIICHAGYNTTTAGQGHATGSAFGSANANSNMSTTILFMCSNCHLSVATPVRPAGATDVHGTNALPSTGATKTGRWLAGGTQGVPIAFVRNTTNLTNHQPANISGTAYTANCSGMNSGTSPCTSSRTNCPYTPGGTY